MSYKSNAFPSNPILNIFSAIFFGRRVQISQEYLIIIYPRAFIIMGGPEMLDTQVMSSYLYSFRIDDTSIPASFLRWILFGSIPLMTVDNHLGALSHTSRRVVAADSL